MNFLVLYLGTVGFSFCVEIAKELRMCKDVADAGYRFDSKKFTSIVKEINPNVNKETILSMLIPFYNAINAVKNDFYYNQIRHILFDQLRVMGVLEEMTEYEKKEYQKKPTGLNALLLQIKIELKMTTATKINFSDNSVIYFDIKEDDFIIYKAEGPVSRLSEEEQKQKIKEVCIKMGKALSNKYDNIDELAADVKANINGTLDLSQTSLDKSPNTENQDNSREARINELKQIKEELLQEQEEVVDKPYGRGRKK